MTEPPAPVRAVVYARVSNDNGSQDEERQLVDLRRLSAAEDLVVVEEIRDRWTGIREDRPGLARVMQMARSRSFDVLLVTEASRISRAGIESLLRIVRELRDVGVTVRSATEPWLSGDGPTTDLLVALAAWAARFERDAIASRTRSKLAALKEAHEHTGQWTTRSGRPIGRPRRVTPEVEDRIRRLRTEGLSWKVIAQRVSIPSGTCRKVRPLPATPAVGNPPAQSEAREASSSLDSGA